MNRGRCVQISTDCSAEGSRGPGGRPSADVTLDAVKVCCHDEMRVLAVSIVMSLVYARAIPSSTAYGRNLGRQPPRDDQPLNLVGALEDLGDLGLAHVALDAVVARVADAPDTLHRAGGAFH